MRQVMSSQIWRCSMTAPMPAQGFTVSRCAENPMRPGTVPGKCAMRLPVSDPVSAAEASKVTVNPISVSFSAHQAAMGASCHDGLSMATISKNESSTRSGFIRVPSFKIPKFFVAGMRPRKTARVRQVPGFAPPFAQAAFVPRRGKNKGQGQVPVGPAASRNNSSRNYYEARMGAATCFLRDSTPGIQLPPSQHSISKTRFTRAGSPSTMNCEPSARMSVTSSRANS